MVKILVNRLKLLGWVFVCLGLMLCLVCFFVFVFFLFFVGLGVLEGYLAQICYKNNNFRQVYAIFTPLTVFRGVILQICGNFLRGLFFFWLILLG